MQLVAYGAQDTAITGKPQITFFRSVYRRHTNFAIESIAQTFIGTANFGRKITTSLSRNGDLVNACVLELTLPGFEKKVVTGPADTNLVYRVPDATNDADVIGQIQDDSGIMKFQSGTYDSTDASTPFTDVQGGKYATAWWEDASSVWHPVVARDGEVLRHQVKWINNLGHYIIREAGLEIGGQKVDTHTGEWLHIWSELTKKQSHNGSKADYGSGYNRMIGNTDMLSSFNEETKIPDTTIYVPLKFWFNDPKQPGLSLPLLALQYHEVRISIEFRDDKDLIVAPGDKKASRTNVTFNKDNCFNAEMYVDYVYLDNEERRRFAQDNHEYLIPQVQFTGEECIGGKCGTSRYRMNFNHPVKELLWVVHNSQEPEPSKYSTFGGRNPVCRAKMMLNGHDRFSERRGEYFDCVQPYMHHTRCPSRGINVYSFAFKPEQHQPSGTCNFSRIDNAQLEVVIRDDATKDADGNEDTNTQFSLRVYAVNYNLLRVMSGLAGVAYSN
jgi:hypothetical protein